MVRSENKIREDSQNKNISSNIMTSKAIYPKKPTKATRAFYAKLDELEAIRSDDKQIQSKLNLVREQFKSGEIKTFKTAKRLSSLLTSNTRQPIKKFNTAYNRVIMKSKTNNGAQVETRQRRTRMTKKGALDAVHEIKITNIRDTGLKGFRHVFDNMEEIEKHIPQNNGVKIQIAASFRYNFPDTNKTDIRHSHSKQHTISTKAELKDALTKAVQELSKVEEDDNFDQKDKGAGGVDTGAYLSGIQSIQITVSNYNPTRGGSFILLPKNIADTQACINIQNKDELCFKYSVQCGYYKIYEKAHPERMGHYKKLEEVDTLKWDISFPASLNDIKKFERENNISINVFRLNDTDNIVLYYQAKIPQTENHVNLLLLHKDRQSHFAYVKNLSRLLNSQYSNHEHRLHFCNTCLHGFQTKKLLDKHLEAGCVASFGSHIQMPEKGEVMEFKNHGRKIKAPFVIYCDFESITKKIDTSEPNPDMPYTQCYQRHECCSFGLQVVSSIEGFEYEPVIYRGENAIDEFIRQILEIEKELTYYVDNPKEMVMTPADVLNFNKSKHCHFCGERFNPIDRKVRDHCHLTGKFRGAAHESCNVNCNFRHFKIPCIFHNLKGYDSHHIISAVSDQIEGKISCIPQNAEKYISFGFSRLMFIDSLSFLPSSLEKLVRANKWGTSGLNHNWWERFRYSSGKNKYIRNREDLDLLTEKGVYPYDFMDSFEKFERSKLPTKKQFYSKLTEEEIRDEDYERAGKVWKNFGLTSMGDYHDLYLLTDILLLADVFENFRDMSMEVYELDPAHYYTSPSLSFDAMLKKTKVKLQLFHDIDMYNMVERGIRGGITQVSEKHLKANNKYLENYDETMESVYIMYLDANNLYGLSMSKKLPLDGFEWVENLSEEDILAHDPEGDVSYILEVDLEYPEEIHDEHSDYPLAPESKKVKVSQLSEKSREIQKIYTGRNDLTEDTAAKLVLDFTKKIKYVVHIDNLQYYLKKGLRLAKTHRTIRFNQARWLEPYINLNTEKRKQAKNEFQKSFFKLMNNATFGKTMENVRNRINYELVNSRARADKVIAAPNFKRATVINKHLLGVEKIKNEVKLDKPIYVGFTILESSKLHMQQFYYETIKPYYGDRASLAYTDTDSFVLKIRTEDVYKDLRENFKSDMDFSDYPAEHPCHDNGNKKVLGKFKDEMNGKVIEEAIFLKPKLYAIKEGESQEKKAKGIPKAAVKNTLTFESYRNTLKENRKDLIKYNSIRSFQHQLYSIHCNKVGLSNFDNKRYWISNTTSLPYGHYLAKP